MRKLIVIALLSTTGCAGSLSTPLSSKVAATGYEEKALIANLKDAYECASDGSCSKFETDQDEDELKLFVDAGIALSNHYCTRFFRVSVVR